MHGETLKLSVTMLNLMLEIGVIKGLLPDDLKFMK